MAGYVKLFRSIENWEWYTDVNTTKLFLHCLIRANHKPNKWRGLTIETGSFVTSYSKLSIETGLSISAIRSSLNRLKSTNEVTHQTTSEHSVINVVKWADYQGCDDDVDTPLDTPTDTPNDRQSTTNKNDKKYKKYKNEENKDIKDKECGRFTPPSLIELTDFIISNHYTIDAQRFIDFYESKGWMIGKNKMKDWKATVRGWQSRDKKEKPTSSFLDMLKEEENEQN